MVDEVKEIVQNVVKKISAKKCCEQEKIRTLWNTVVPQKANRHASIREFDGERLIIYCDSPAWIYQMNLRKKGFLVKIQKEIPEIKKLVFKIGSIQ